MQENIHFFSEDVEFTPAEEGELRNWLAMVSGKYGYKIHQLDYIFCSDEYLLKLNKRYLEHDDYTDILTFPYHVEGSKDLMSDIYISVDRVKENAESEGINFVDELHRVMIHGLLHMTGFNDKDKSSAADMRKAEDLALSLRMF